MNERLLLSSTSYIHRESCATMRHVVDGRAPRTRIEWRRTYESFPSPVLAGPNEHVEHYLVRDEESHATDYVNLLITPAELATRTTKYVRCGVCAPEVPEFTPPVRTTQKRAGNLAAADLGRSSTLGLITRILHAATGVELTFVDGSAAALDFTDTIEFYPRAGRKTGASE